MPITSRESARNANPGEMAFVPSRTAGMILADAREEARSIYGVSDEARRNMERAALRLTLEAAYMILRHVATNAYPHTSERMDADEIGRNINRLIERMAAADNLPNDRREGLRECNIGPCPEAVLAAGRWACTNAAHHA